MTTTAKQSTLLLVCAALMLTAATGYCRADSAEKLISLAVQNEPLGAVLDRIAADTGYRFALDDQWASVPVSTQLNRFPLDRALKRILREFDHVIIYYPERLIEIRVFGMTESEAKRAAAKHTYTPTVYPAAQQPEFVEPFDETAADRAETASDSPGGEPESTGEPTTRKTAESTENEPSPVDPEERSGMPKDKQPAGNAWD
jgi:hypothetical protein